MPPKPREPAQPEPDLPSSFVIPHDPLSEVLDQVRFGSLSCSIMRATPPFAVTGAPDGYHTIVVTHGQIYVEASDPRDFDPILVQPGDVLIIPRGISFRFLYPLGVPRDTPPRLAHVRDASPRRPDEIELVGIRCYFDKAHRNLLTDLLPPVIHLKKGTAGLATWLNRTIELFRAEYLTRLRGRSSVLARLVEMISVQALRIWIEQMPSEIRGWIQALKDDRIALTLQAIHRDPGHRWTVASLARHANMSRTVFATRFKLLVGHSPMEYVSLWRMHRAVVLLEGGARNLKAVADASGYRSTTTFRANFRRRFGMLPSDYKNYKKG